MSNLKRDPVKYIRDAIKSQYVKDGECYICKSIDNLQFHHFYSVAELWKKWSLKNKVVIRDVDDILELRDEFLEEHHNEMVNEAVTLCSYCHNDRLHKIYGKSPSLGTAKKQKRWVEIQKTKHRGT